MATLTKQFGLNNNSGGTAADLDSNRWAGNAGGATNITFLSAGYNVSSPNDPVNAPGFPLGASIAIRRTGKNITNGAPYWEWSGTWVDLGLAAGDTITAVNLNFDWLCQNYITGAAGTAGPAELRDSAGTLRGTFSTSSAFSSTTAWATKAGTNLTGLSDAGTTSIKLRLNAVPKTGSSSSAQVDVAMDWVVVTVTYTAASASSMPPLPTIIQQAVQRAAVR